ncbi:MAG: twin-arginine translocation signal domain-containing protein, partial [Bryobacteraceae bacterium]
MPSPVRPDRTDVVSRRDVIKLGAVAGGAAAVASAPAIRRVHAASDQVKFGLIGTGSRGTYLLDHLAKLDNGHCTAVC